MTTFKEMIQTYEALEERKGIIQVFLGFLEPPFDHRRALGAFSQEVRDWMGKELRGIEAPIAGQLEEYEKWEVSNEPEGEARNDEAKQEPKAKRRIAVSRGVRTKGS